MKLDAKTRAEVGRLVAEIARIAADGPAAPGTVISRNMRCGKPGCRCSEDPPRYHGPYRSWTRKIGNKTVTRYFSEEQFADYEPLFETARRLRALIDELEAIGLNVIESDSRWKR